MSQRKQLKKLNKLLEQVRKEEALLADLSDEELASMTEGFKLELRKGSSPEELLPRAFAVVSEADFRVLGKRPYDVQILGAAALYQGYMTEMNTGEGKSLTATMPLYLNALTGKSSILVTTNEYLALRDEAEMGQVYRFLGLSSACGVAAPGQEEFGIPEKRAAYRADILYTTHGALGFDYLIHNLAKSREEQFLREYDYIIVDEADSVLLDGAVMPLIISGSPRVQSNLYDMTDFFVSTLIPKEDYEEEEAAVWLTESGSAKAERFFRIDNFYGEAHFELNRHVILALRAHILMKKERDYMVSDKSEVLLLDGSSGRAMNGMKLRGGLHQAIEAKEKVKITQENRSMAAITFQNLFLLFPKLAGMSGTLKSAKNELLEVYGKEVLVIPSNRPVIRQDLRDLFFMKKEEALKAAAAEVEALHGAGRPVLVLMTSIAETEAVSRLLAQAAVPHSVLNANNAFWEADMIREAGQKGAVTVATSMVGRGTDIRLGDGVAELGGLAVIGIGRMENVRLERQARGRSGRQGDPGSSRFYVSLEDDVFFKKRREDLERWQEKGKHFSSGRICRLLKGAQRQAEERAAFSRSQSMRYDRIVQRQRDIMYATRNHLLEGEILQPAELSRMIDVCLSEYLAKNSAEDSQKLSRFILDNISYHLPPDMADILTLNGVRLRMKLKALILMHLGEKREQLEHLFAWEQFERLCMLTAVDEAWVEQVDYLQQLQAAVGGRSYAQRDPYFEYQKEAFEAFEKMGRRIYINTMRNLLLSEAEIDERGELRVYFP